MMGFSDFLLPGVRSSLHWVFGAWLAYNWTFFEIRPNGDAGPNGLIVGLPSSLNGYRTCARLQRSEIILTTTPIPWTLRTRGGLGS